jgi:hypothetical protein
VVLQCLSEGFRDRVLIADIALYAVEVGITFRRERVWAEVVGRDLAPLCCPVVNDYPSPFCEFILFLVYCA